MRIYDFSWRSGEDEINGKVAVWCGNKRGSPLAITYLHADTVDFKGKTSIA